MNGNKPSIEISPGVLAETHTEQLFQNGSISYNGDNGPPGIDSSAFDLRLGRTAWKLAEGQRPATRELAKIRTNSSPVPVLEDSDGEYFLFEKGQIYLVDLEPYLDLPPNINGRATGKSSIGRLDVITRLLTNNSGEYDVVEAGYNGPLYLLVLPQTFSIKVSPNDSLNQLRLFSGPPYASVITRPMISHFGTPFWYVLSDYRRNVHEPWSEIVARGNNSLTLDPGLFDLTVDLADPDLPYIFKALPDADEAEPTNLDPIDLRKDPGSHDPSHYFEKVSIDYDHGSSSVLLGKDSFYIMKSKERLYIPSNVAVEVIAISERIGDIRIHYAGFAHPWFGRHDDEGSTRFGTPLIFEVRATDMNTRLYDRSLLAKIQLFRMSSETKHEPSVYDEQELKLSKVFHDWPGDA